MFTVTSDFTHICIYMKFIQIELLRYYDVYFQLGSYIYIFILTLSIPKQHSSYGPIFLNKIKYLLTYNKCTLFSLGFYKK